MYGAILSLHILSALATFAAIAVFAVTLDKLAARVISYAALGLVATGIYQTVDRWDFGEWWISASFAIVLVVGGIGGAVLAPMADRVKGGEVAVASQARTAAYVAGGLVALAVVLMTTGSTPG